MDLRVQFNELYVMAMDRRLNSNRVGVACCFEFQQLYRQQTFCCRGATSPPAHENVGLESFELEARSARAITCSTGLRILRLPNRSSTTSSVARHIHDLADSGLHVVQGLRKIY